MGYKLDLGCGRQKQPGCLGVDYEDFGQEIVRDLTKGLPFSDGTVSEIHMNHTLEHFANGEELWFLIAEWFRVCHDGARIFVRVPHADTPDAHNPSHLSFWNEKSVEIFNRRAFPLAAVPKRHQWDFDIARMTRSGIEFAFELIVHKPQHFVKPESGKITIITVAFNQLEHTKRFVQSIRRNTQNLYRIIVVNNASTDGTEEWLDLQKDLDALHLAENKGWVGGINTALPLVEPESDFIVFANNDVIVGERWDRLLLNHFDHSVGAVGPTSNYVAGRQNVCFNHAGILEEEVNALIGFFMCVRKDVAATCGPLDDLYSFRKEGAVLSGGDDLDYSIRIRELGLRLLVARDVYVYHAGSQSIKDALGDQEYRDLCGDASEALVAKWGESEASLLGKSPIRVVCGVPMRGDWMHRSFGFTLSLVAKPFNWSLHDLPRAHVAIARNNLVNYAKSQQASHVLLLDDDHILTPDLFTRLYRMDVPVASALAFQRYAPYSPSIYKWVTTDTGKQACVPIDEFIRTGVRHVGCTGFAAVLIKMEVFEKIQDPYFEWRELGEDFDFCLKCRDAGIEIYCDTDLILDHIGDNQIINEQIYRAALSTQAQAQVAR